MEMMRSTKRNNNPIKIKPKARKIKPTQKQHNKQSQKVRKKGNKKIKQLIHKNSQR